MSDRFEVLVVCTGNMCRSPMIEHLLQRRLEEFGNSALERPWHVRSAGTNVPPGAWVHELALEALGRKGIRVPPTPSRTLAEADPSSAHLILVATAAHRTEVVTGCPSLVRRTFTLLQFARWCAASRAQDPASAGRSAAAALDGDELVQRAIAARAGLQPADPADLDLPDPMGGALPVFERALDRIDRAIGEILGPPPPRRTPPPFDPARLAGSNLAQSWSVP
jgi:protein-tyrosine phosphatase